MNSSGQQVDTMRRWQISYVPNAVNNFIQQNGILSKNRNCLHKYNRWGTPPDYIKKINVNIMSDRNVGTAWAKKAYLWLSLVVVAIIWIAFLIHFVILGHAPVEANWGEEIGKWLLMTPILVGIVDCIAYALIGTIAARRAHGLEGPLAKKKEEEDKENK
jgi:hypothetical protein